jgi:predicted nucleotidyltransferase
MSINIRAARQAFQARLQKDLAEREASRERALKAVRAVAPQIIARYSTVKTAYLFGSILRSGAFRVDSDIDIAVKGASAEDYFALWHDLEDALPDWFIDLRDLPPDTFFTRWVYETGEKIYG